MPPSKLSDDEATLAGRWLANPPPGEEVCITGLAGNFPESDNVHQFRDNLLNKVDMVVENHGRWSMEHPDLPLRLGKISNLDKFDAGFFGYYGKEVDVLDPMSRVLLEKAYEAIVDAGVNPSDLRGSRTGVFIGACSSEKEKEAPTEMHPTSYMDMYGNLRAGFANRISHWLRVNGPSYTIDTACSSSLFALEHAYRAIRDGDCDQALVGGANFCLHPYITIQFMNLGVLSPQGMCKSFDSQANGYVRSESTNMIFLQKTKDAKRVYATVVHAKTNCDGYKLQGITYPSGRIQKELLEELYDECQISPSSLGWVEAHGTGTMVGDPEELDSLSSVMCQGRTSPLLIGSVKSNIGHTEPSSGLCSVTKAIIAMETGLIPPNIHYEAPRAGVKGLIDGSLKVITEVEPWDSGLVGVNSFGFGGANSHVLLRGNTKKKINGGEPHDKIPRLVVISSRSKDGVNQILDDLESRPVDAELVGLYHALHEKEIPTHNYRGYILLKHGQSVRDAQYYEKSVRPVWFILAGCASQWGGLAGSLNTIPAFACAIERCHLALKPLGLDLMKIVFSVEVERDPIHESVITTAVQIGLLDVLNSLEIHPKGIIGYSIGELAAGYADKCITLEQAIQAAYYRGKTLLDMSFQDGSMAQIELGQKAVEAILPLELEIVQDDSSNRCFVVGPAEAITAFITFLRASGIAAEEATSSHIAAHSRNLKSAAPQLLHCLKKVIPSPKPRSETWVRSSATDATCKTPKESLGSAEYFTNTLLSPVVLEEACKQIPINATIIELSSDSALRNVISVRGLRRTHISLVDAKLDATEHLLTSLGRLFKNGIDMKLASLYPAVDFPVSRQTAMISPLISWDHSKQWFVNYFEVNQEAEKSGERLWSIFTSRFNHEFYKGHVIDGRNLFPATGYLALVWETFSLSLHCMMEDVPVVFENVRFQRATNLPSSGGVDFLVIIQKSTGNFEILEGSSIIVTGRIHKPNDINKEMVRLPVGLCGSSHLDRPTVELSAKDIYKELNLRGYNYTGVFKSIVRANNKGTRGEISWVTNWVAFIDNMLQVQILGEDTRGLFVPTSLDKLIIDPVLHMHMVKEMQAAGEEIVFDVLYNHEVGIIKSGGIEVRGLHASAIARRKTLGEPVLEKYHFLPNNYETSEGACTLNLAEALRVFLHLALENQQCTDVKCFEIADGEATKPLLAPQMIAILEDLPLMRPLITVLSKGNNPLTADLPPDVQVEDKSLAGEKNYNIVMGTNLLDRPEVLKSVIPCIGATGYIISRERLDQPMKQCSGLHVVNDYRLTDERLLLLKKVMPIVDPLVIIINEDNFNWVPKLQAVVKREKSAQRILIVAQGEPMNGILGMFNCICKEPGVEFVRCFFIIDRDAPEFDPELPFYQNQIAKDTVMNVYKDGRWGSYRHFQLEESSLVDAKHVYANLMTRGDLSSFKWFEGPIQPEKLELAPRQDLVQVYYSALNFRDVMTATGKLAAEVVAKGRLNQECVQGLEFSGRDSKGNRVMGMVSSGAMSSLVLADTDLLWNIPDDWTLEDAATVPVVYGTAYYALMMGGGMKKGDTVLIHAGSGGVGQAAINIALHEVCDVFTTVGTQEKRDFIKKRFPQLTDRHIGNSRDTSFEQLVMSETNGRGVDLVLNSLAEEKLQASLRCLTVGGRFMEIGKFDLAANNTIGMEFFVRETSFHGIMLDNLFSAKSEDKRPIFEILEKGIKEGAVRPLSRTVFSDTEVEEAFRYMAAGKHVGKVLLKIRPEESEKTLITDIPMRKGLPRFFCNPNHTYVIAGGLGGFGLEMADWMVLRGARNLVLTSRHGLRTGYQKSRVEIWKTYGASVVISTRDISTEDGVRALLKDANDLGPVAGIFNLAVTLHDALFENQTADKFVASALPKATATNHLDAVSRVLCPQLQHFVVFSSVTCGRGTPGQTNYGMANSVMERICERRVEDGYPGLAVQWGAVGEVGLVAEMQDGDVEVVVGGTLQQRMSSCLQVLDRFLRQSHPVVASMVVAEKRSTSGSSGNVVDSVLNILGLKDLNTVSTNSTLADLGMDSMMIVEVKQLLERDFEIFLSPQEMRGLTFEMLIELRDAAEEKANKDEETDEVHEDAFQFMIRAFGTEETASRPTTNLPSLGEIDPLGTIIMVPGIEGMTSVLEPLASNLTSRTVGLELGYLTGNATDSTLEMAKAMIPHLKENLDPNMPFRILGYSYGSLVALDLAMLLENEGHQGEVFLVDGSPDFSQEICRRMLVDGSEDNLQVNLLITALNLIKKQSSSHIESIRTELIHLDTWEKRLERMFTLIPYTATSHDHIRSVANSTYKRIQSILNYTWSHLGKLKSNITLLRPNYLAIQTSEDYGLAKYCEKTVDVHFVDGDHVSILQSLQVANIINSPVIDKARGL